MADCPNCGAPLEDDARFCANCGAPVVPEAAPDAAPVPEAPAAEAESPAVSETPSAGAEVPVAEFADPAAAGPSTASGTVICPNCGEPTDAGSDRCAHCGAALGTGERADAAPADEKSGSRLKPWMIYAGIGVVVIALIVVLIAIFSGGGKGYGLYVKDRELYYSDLSKDGARQVTSRLAGDADNSDFTYGVYTLSSRIVMGGDGRTLFFPDKLSTLGYGDSFALYYRDAANGKKDAVKIDSDVTRYAVSGNAGLVTYLKNGGLYRYTLRRDEKEKLAGGVYDFYVSDDGKKLLYIDDDDILYQLDDGREKQKLDSDVYYVAAASDDCKTLVYQKDDILYLKQDGRDKVKIAADVYDTICAYDSGAAYYLKEDGGEFTLYYFDGRDSAVLTDELYDWYDCSYDVPLLVYRNDDGEYCLAAGGKVTALDAGDPVSFTFSEDGKSVWYVDEPDRRGEGALYRIAVSNGAAQKAVKQDDDVYAYNLFCTSDARPVYFKDVSDDAGALYVDGKKADDDVYCYSVQESGAGALLYFTDYSAGKRYGTLKQYSGGKAAKIADDVAQAVWTPDGRVLYLADYSSSRYRGDLYVYSGGKPVKLDEDVTAVIPVYDYKYRGY